MTHRLLLLTVVALTGCGAAPTSPPKTSSTNEVAPAQEIPPPTERPLTSPSDLESEVPPRVTYSPPRRVGKGYLWEVTSPTAKVFIQGTIVIPHELYDTAQVPEGVDEPMDQADVLLRCREVDFTFWVTGGGRSAMYPKGGSLEEHVAKTTYEQLNSVLQQRGVAPVYGNFKLWAVALMLPSLDADQTGNAWTGLDMYFRGRARDRRIPDTSLVDAQEMVRHAAEAPEAVQEQMLLGSLAEGDRLDLTRRLYAAYESGDIEQFEREFEQDAADPAVAAFREAWLYGPNETMAAAIKSLFDERKTYYVLLRTERLVGKRSVIDLLEAGLDAP